MRSRLLVVMIMSITGVALGQDLREKNTVIGVKGGLISSGTVFVEDFEFDTDMSYSLGGFLDYRLAPKLLGGVAVDVHNISAFDESETLFNVGLALKAIIAGETSNLMFRPGLVIGYGSLGSTAETESSQYFTIGGNAELIFMTQGSFSWLGEVGIYAGPSGGNSEFDITFGPMFIIRGGIVFN